jgi:adenylate cyclase
MFTWSNPVEAIGESYRLALAALKCDSLDPSALSALAVASVYLGQHEAAIEYAEKAVEFNPSSSTGQYSLGFVRNLNSQPAEAIAVLDTAIRLSPNDYFVPNYFGTLSTAYYMKGDYVRACEVARYSIRKAPYYPHGYRCLANALGQMGQLEEGRQALGEFLKLAPDYRTTMARQVVRFAKETDFERYMDGLHKLGWTD